MAYPILAVTSHAHSEWLTNGKKNLMCPDCSTLRFHITWILNLLNCWRILFVKEIIMSKCLRFKPLVFDMWLYIEKEIVWFEENCYSRSNYKTLWSIFIVLKCCVKFEFARNYFRPIEIWNRPTKFRIRSFSKSIE